MSEAAPPYGTSRIGLVRPGPGEVDAQVIDVRRVGQLAGREAESYQGVPPVKKAPWEWYIPLYLWTGGIAAGSWVAAAAEDLAGVGDRAVIRAGRYLALGCVLGGTAMLIADLGRPERFLKMLRIIRPRSAMSIGSWGLSTFGAFVGAGAALQAAEDGLVGARPRLTRLSRGWLGRSVHLAGLPFALLVGTYTGTLLSATATPAWARRNTLLAPLFLLSSASNGLAAVSAIAGRSRAGGARVGRRLARGEAIALGGELALLAVDRRVGAGLPSKRTAPPVTRIARWLTVTAGVALPCALTVAKGWGPRRRGLPQRAGDRRWAARLGSIASGLTLAGGLALRYLIFREGERSADTPGDTWAFAALDDDRRLAGARLGGGGPAHRPAPATVGDAR